MKQVTLYMKATGMKRAILTYICKNDGRVVDHIVEYDESVIERELSDAKLMSKCLSEGSLPPKLDDCYASHAARAKKCAVCKQCFQEER